MPPSTAAYGKQVPESDVSYEAPRSSAEVGYYYLISDPTVRVVWVNAANQESLSPQGGFFALYTGEVADYASVVTEAA